MAVKPVDQCQVHECGRKVAWRIRFKTNCCETYIAMSYCREDFLAKMGPGSWTCEVDRGGCGTRYNKTLSLMEVINIE